MSELLKVALEAGLTVGPIVTGLWQMADQERDGAATDLDAAAEALAAYARAGFDSFDMADHYGSAEILAGRAVRILTSEGRPAPLIMTKWCPPPAPMTPEVVRAGVERALERLGLNRVDVMQLHWWRYDHPGYLDAMAELMRLRDEGLIGRLGVTNFDAAHLRVLVKHGIEIATNQVCFSLLDRRAAGRMSAVCAELGVKLLAFGTLGGGFLSESWLGAPEPVAMPDWSKMKYQRFIEVVGGWAVFQRLLQALDGVARKHGTSIANVATGWVLDHDAVAAVIIGARLGEREHRADNLRMLRLRLDAEDRAAIDRATAQLALIPGDCGDEYRRPPFLTAAGDLSDHLDAVPKVYATAPVPARPKRARVDTGSVWEEAAGFSRAVRVGDRILVSGTTATDAHGACVCEGDVEGQTVFILDKIAAALDALGASLDDVVRTRIYVTDLERWQEAAHAHARAFRDVRPTNTLVAVAGLVGPHLVEIEADADVASGTLPAT